MPDILREHLSGVNIEEILFERWIFRMRMRNIIGDINFRRKFMFESLILAQDERWRRAYHMQVERFFSEKSGGRVSNAWVTCPVHTDNIPKGMLIRDNI